MQIHTHPQLPPKKAIWAIGNFDGLHAGHHTLLAHAKHLSQTHHLPWGVLTFEPHPRQVLTSAKPFHRLLTPTQKQAALQAANIPHLAIIPFTPEFSHLTADQFIHTHLIQWLQPSHLIVGQNFHFGHKAQGTTATLQACPHFTTHILPLVTDAQGPLSSTRLRSQNTQ